MTTELLETYELYLKASEAYEVVPKEFIKRTEVEHYYYLSCPNCGIVFARVPLWAFGHRFNEPIFCCGKLMV